MILLGTARSRAAILGLTVCAATACGLHRSRAARLESGLHDLPGREITDIFRFNQARLRLEDRMAHFKVPGLSMTVIAGTRIDFSRSYGLRVADPAIPVTRDTIFEAGSTSKLVTAVLTMRLVQQGLLSLDDPVNDHLESWRVPDDDLTREQPVTLRMLLSHTSGLNRPDSMYAFEAGTSPTLLDVLEGRPPAINDPVKVEHLPGSRHRYSNIAYNVIQLLVEEATGKPFAEVMRAEVFDPLEMTSCTYQFPFSAATLGRVAFPHDAEMTPAMNDLHPSALAHGGLLCTSEDLAKLAVELMRVYRGDSGRILSRETLAEMLVSQHDPEDDVGGFNGQGLGVFLLEDQSTLYFAHHGYNTPGTCCLLMANPERGDGAVIMANGARGFPLFFEIMAGVVDLYGWPAVRTAAPDA